MAGSTLCPLCPGTQASVTLTTCLHGLDVPLLAPLTGELWGMPRDFRGWAAGTSHTGVQDPTPGGRVCLEPYVNGAPWSCAGSAPFLGSPQARKEERSFMGLVLMF